MYADELKFAPEDLAWLDLPNEELVFEDLPDIDTLLRIAPTALSPPPTAGQTTYTQSVTIRIPRCILDELRQRAAERGERYQTFVNQILAQYAATTPDHDRRAEGVSPRDFSTS